jgi:hypothetical protein
MPSTLKTPTACCLISFLIRLEKAVVPKDMNRQAQTASHIEWIYLWKNSHAKMILFLTGFTGL